MRRGDLAMDLAMDRVYRPPSILLLTGITMKDYVSVEDMADSVLLAGTLDHGAAGAALGPEDPPPEADTPPDKIPRAFTGLEDWPHGTNLRCWACDFTFDDRPKFVPTYVREPESGGIEFGVLGNMCTFNCAELWIETHLGGRASNEERWRAQDNLCLVYFLFTGRRVSRVKPAPRKTEMQKYGGDWDEDTFWRKLRELDPLAGLRDHTPGSVVPERDRAKSALASLRTRPLAALVAPARGPPDARLGVPPEEPGGALAGPSLRAGPPGSVWGACGAAPAALPVAALPAAPAPPAALPAAPAPPAAAPPREARTDNIEAPGLGAAELEDLLAGKQSPMPAPAPDAGPLAPDADPPAPDAGPPAPDAPVVCISDADLDELMAGFGGL